MTQQEQITLKETVDLRHWIKRCSKAGVPFVPTDVCPLSLPIVSILRSDDIPTDLYPISSWTEEMVHEVSTRHGKAMWRWSHCSPIEVKAAFANPGLPVRIPWPADATKDSRFVSILVDCRRSGLRDFTTIVRPWVKAAIEGDFPVEFRVFVTAKGKTSTSSYYTQRALSDRWLPEAQEATRMARYLHHSVGASIAFSADFIVTQSNEILFLEGGPPTHYGADPCCFKPDHPFGDGRILFHKESHSS